MQCKMTDHRAKLARFIHGKLFSNTVIALILINAITLGLETNRELMAVHGKLLHMIDHAILGIFTVELALRIYTFRRKFFLSGWNVFDFIIVGVSLMPHIGASFSMLRAFRIFRALRLISAVPSMRKVITALVTSIPGMMSIMSILFIVFYVSAVFATQVLGAVVDDPKMQELYGTIGHSLFTLFQLMTLDGYTTDIIKPTLVHFPHALPYFVIFMIVTTFSVLNLFVGIIVDALSTLNEERVEAEHDRQHEEEMQALRELKAEVERLIAASKVK